MRSFRKYEFGSKGAATAKINALGVDSDGYPSHNHCVVNMGKIEGSDKHHVDVYWDGEPESSWDNNMIWCTPIGVHSFGSESEIEYTTAYNAANE